MTDILEVSSEYPKNKDTGELDYDRNPTMKLKVPYWDGNFNVENHFGHASSSL